VEFLLLGVGDSVSNPKPIASACRDIAPARNSIPGFLALISPAWKQLYVDGASCTI
jgi:hypothetical protein